MTGLSERDMYRLQTGLALTRNMTQSVTVALEDEARIMTALRNESSTQMLLDVARGDIKKLEQEIDGMLAVVWSYTQSFIKP